MGILQEKVYKTRITDLDELKQRLRMEWAKLDHVVSGVVDSCRAVMHVIVCLSCNISHMQLSTGFKSGKFGGPVEVG